MRPTPTRRRSGAAARPYTASPASTSRAPPLNSVTELSPVRAESGSQLRAMERQTKPLSVASSRMANRNNESVESSNGLVVSGVTAVMSELLGISGRTLLRMSFGNCQIDAWHCQALPCAGQLSDLGHVFLA